MRLIILYAIALLLPLSACQRPGPRLGAYIFYIVNNSDTKVKYLQFRVDNSEKVISWSHLVDLSSDEYYGDGGALFRTMSYTGLYHIRILTDSETVFASETLKLPKVKLNGGYDVKVLVVINEDKTITTRCIDVKW